MLKGNEKKKWLGRIAVVAVCLAVVGVAQADWQEQAKLVASDGAFFDRFGISVSISGDYAIVGADLDDDSGVWSGSAYIFKRSDDQNDPNWYQEAKLTASNGDAYDYFGRVVSISGDNAIVGAPQGNHNGIDCGTAYIFEKPSDGWVDAIETTKLTASDGRAYDWFGVSVSIDNNYAIVGALSGGGSVYIFRRDGETWNEKAKLVALDGAFADRFGISVSTSGGYTIVGADLDDDNGDESGSAYIFWRDGTSWTQEAKIITSDGDAYDRFGCSVSISGDYAIVGAHWDDDKTGSAYIFKRDGTNWTEQAKLTASDGDPCDYFGISVSITGEYAIVGASYDDVNGIVNRGSVYVFRRDGATWTQVERITDPDGPPNEGFGTSVSISAEYSIVGAVYDDDYTGSAYIFARERGLVEIDIKPGGYPNAINLGSHGLIPVAILSSEEFDANSVDADTVELAGSGVAMRGKSNKFLAHEEDVNGDGLLDLVVQVATENLDPDSFQDGFAVLTAKTYDGQAIEGEDEIIIVPPE